MASRGFGENIPWTNTSIFLTDLSEIINTSLINCVTYLKVTPLHPRILCDQFGSNWINGIGEEEQNTSQTILDWQKDKQTDSQSSLDHVWNAKTKKYNIAQKRMLRFHDKPVTVYKLYKNRLHACDEYVSSSWWKKNE